MKFFDRFQATLEKIVGPIAARVSSSRYIKALTEGFMYTMPITLGVAVIAVLSNLPITAWLNFLKQVGIYQVSQDIVSLTLSLLAIYVVGAIGYCFTKNEGENGVIGALISTAAFLVLIPIQYAKVNGAEITALETKYMGSDGIFIAIILGLLIPQLYCFLMSKNLKLKLPDSVPPMVSKSLTPTFVSMIIFSILFVIKYVCTLTPYGNLYTLIATFISKPITHLGASPIALIIVFTLINLMWFFGIHPNTILMPYMPILMAAGVANTEAFVSGKALPFFTFVVISSCIQVGGAGSTLGLCVATIFSKSEKYKSMRKLVVPANLFNINEPVIFGFPIMLNPIYFVPMILTPILNGTIGIILSKIIPITINPTISMPWVTPAFVSAFFIGGVGLLIVWLVCLLVDFLIYLPFFMIDDKNALLEEKANI
ncbi:PTS sugar transporter subunit IIC [Enterococcus cecorum]|nr:PTS sugar transporter subunit IIC [Enterococcus cecorum]HJF78836.1 PTS transporter subunit EIIC [Enterococcus cecorum]